MKQELKFVDVFQQLPKGYRERALANYRANAKERGWADLMENEKVINTGQHPLVAAIGQGFIWFSTPEGYDFWEAVRDHYYLGRPLPALPKPTTHTNPTT